MNKKHILLIGSVSLVTLGLLLLAVHAANNRHVAAQKVVTGPSLSQQLKTAQAQAKGYQTSVQTLTAQNTELANEKTHFCSELSQHKLTDALCVQ